MGTRRSLEMLANDCIREFRTANVHSILKVSPDSDIDQIKQAIHNYSSRNSLDRDATKVLIVNRFEFLFCDPNSFLSYLLLAKVRPFYLSKDDQGTIDHLRGEVDKWKRQFESSRTDICRLKEKLRNTQNDLASKEASLAAAQAELDRKTASLDRLKAEVMSLEALCALMFLCICILTFTICKSLLQFYFSVEILCALMFVLICILCCMIFRSMIEEYLNI